MSTHKPKDDEFVILLYKIDTKIFKEKNEYGKLKSKIKRLESQNVDWMVIPLEKEAAVNLFLDGLGTKKELLH